MMRNPGDIELGQVAGTNQPLILPKTGRQTHLYVCGSTNSGKSKFLECLVRQDIADWSRTKTGLMVLDPHGSLYDNLMDWLAWHPALADRPIIPIDLRQRDWIIPYNVLRPRAGASASVVVDNVVRAMAHVWGQAGTDQTPLFARIAADFLHPLYERGYTLVEAFQLLDDPAFRRVITEQLKDRLARRDWQVANRLSAKDFEAQISSTVNRLHRFLSNEHMCAILGQSQQTLDLRQVLDDGAILLVCTSREGGAVSDEDANLFATLLLNDLWEAARLRGKPKDARDIRSFHVYVDEFQRFVTPTLAENLNEARGYGIHLTMAHQYPSQLTENGTNGKRLYNSIMANANSKVVFRTQIPGDLPDLAQWLFMGVMNPDEIKHELYSTKVMGYREEYRKAYSRSRSHSQGGGEHHSLVEGGGGGQSIQYFDENGMAVSGMAESSNEYLADTAGESTSWSEVESESESKVPILLPVFGQELSHVQFRSLEEQLFRAMATLFAQDQRQCVARLTGMKAPVSLMTPFVSNPPTPQARLQRYREKLFERLPYALRMADAVSLIEERRQKLLASPLELSGSDEPVSAKRSLPKS